MRQDKFSKTNIILYTLGIIPVIWLSLLIAPYTTDGLVGIVENFSVIMDNPFHISLCEDSLKTVLILLLVYALGIGIYLSTDKNYRRREEHGSAKWGKATVIKKKYADKDSEKNKLLTQNTAIGLDGRKHRRNLNVLVCGGSGSGKTRFYAKPNIMQANTSFIVLDPKGELLRDTGHLLEANGYEIKVLDLINMDKSDCYNPFVYIKDDNDIQRLVTNLFKNTTPKGSQAQDPFWDQTASMLLKALISFLHYEAPPEEQNFSTVLEMIRQCDVSEEDEYLVSPLDALFEALEKKDPQHIALKYYRSYHKGAGKTLKSIQISVSIIIQNMAQLKALFEKQWESIVGNCDEFLYLGGNEQSTHEYISKLLGKETIDTNTFGKSTGRNGNYSTNYQILGRELLTPDEVRMLDNRYALLFIRGERPVQDLKYDILKHPNVALTTDGKMKPYIHGFDDYSVGDLFLQDIEEAEENENNESIDDTNFAVYSSEEIEEILRNESEVYANEKK